MEILRMFSSDTKCYIIVIITLLTCFLPSTYSKQYRTDYVYNRKTDAFYKFHMETVIFSQAKKLCDVEGASLMVPRSEQDIEQAHALYKQYPDIENVAWIGNDGKEHESTEEIAESIDLDHDFEDLPRLIHLSTTSLDDCDVLKRDGEEQRSTSCYRSLPFICKVDASDAVQDKQCKVFGAGYKYFENVGSCYKIPRQAFQWNEAYAECHAHGAHLIILNSELEHQVVYNFTNEEPIVSNSETPWFFHAGIRAEKKTDGSLRVFKTIFNETMEEAGYSQWSVNEPNNSQNQEYCVSIFRNDGKYNDINCKEQLGFICEKEV